MAMMSQVLSSPAVMGGMGDIFNLTTAIGAYKTSQEEGDSGAVSLAKGVGNFAWGEFYYGGIGRIVNEKGIPLPGGKKLTLGSMFGTPMRKLGQGIGGAIGGTVGSIGGTVASAAGVSGSIRKGLAGGAKWGAKVGGFTGGMAGAMIPAFALSLAPQMLAQLPRAWEHTANVMTKAYRQRGKLGSGYFEMSQAGYTMRQRSLNAIRQNGLNTQSVLGNEARTYFRSSGYDE